MPPTENISAFLLRLRAVRDAEQCAVHPCKVFGIAKHLAVAVDLLVGKTVQIFAAAIADKGGAEDVAEEVRKTAVRAYNLLGCDGLSRVDFFVTEKEHRVILNEINTLPGFTSISMYPKLWENAGTPYSELLEKLIDCAFTRED